MYDSVAAIVRQKAVREFTTLLQHRVKWFLDGFLGRYDTHPNNTSGFLHPVYFF